MAERWLAADDWWYGAITKQDLWTVNTTQTEPVYYIVTTSEIQDPLKNTKLDLPAVITESPM